MNSRSAAADRPLGFITWMQIIGCLLVILGHSYPFVSSIPAWASRLQLFIYDFHMPLFVWCSGYLIVAARQTEKYAFPAYAKRRAAHILLPYLAFSLIGIAPKVLLSGLLNDTLSFDLPQLIRAFLVPRESIWGHFWFLPMIYILGIAGYAAEKLSRGKQAIPVYALCLALGIAGYFAPKITGWFAADDAVHYAVYLVLGMVCARHLPFITARAWPAGLICLLGSIALFALLPHTRVVSFAISLAMLVAVWIFSLCFHKLWPVGRSAAWAQTYSIFILSWPCQLVAQVLLERLAHQPFAVVFPAMLAAGVVGPLAIIAGADWFEKKTNIKLISKMIGR